MRFTSTVTALAAVAAAHAASISHGHAAMHRRMQEHALEQRSVGHVLHAEHANRLSQLGCLQGKNEVANNGGVWIGVDGQYTNTFHNQAGEDVILVAWGPEGSWVNANQPLVTMTVPDGCNRTLSFADGASGAWAAIYADTEMVNGQICNTWGEHTFGEWGVVDVSREVNMEGHHMRIHGPQCSSTMEQCVFVCPAGQKSCWMEYELHNCQPGSQPGAQYGLDYGAPSGGCGGMGKGASLRTVLGK